MGFLSGGTESVKNYRLTCMEKTVAVVVVSVPGYDEEFTHLKGSPLSTHNAEMVRDMFVDLGFDRVTWFHDSTATRHNILNELKELSHTGNVILFFSGCAYRHTLAPVDANDQELGASSISAVDIATHMNSENECFVVSDSNAFEFLLPFTVDQSGKLKGSNDALNNGNLIALLSGSSSPCTDFAGSFAKAVSDAIKCPKLQNINNTTNYGLWLNVARAMHKRPILQASNRRLIASRHILRRTTHHCIL